MFATFAAALLATSAQAADFSFTGSFLADNGKAGYTFTLGSASTVTLASLGYAGGTNLAGATIARGGFDPVLTIYNAATGFAIADADDGPGSPADSVTGASGDPIYSALLAAGSYTVYLTQYNNFGPASLPGLFGFDGQPNFRGGFVDFYGDQRNGNWALDISGVDSVATASVPEPATWGLMIVGFGMVGAAARRRHRAVAA
jgi:hypothetical protein